MEEYNEARAHILQLTSGYVLLIDNKTHAYPTIKALQTGLGREIAKRPPRKPTPNGQPQVGLVPDTAAPAEDVTALQVQIFNFGRVLSDLQNLTLQDFERAEAAYFPDVARLDWAQDALKQSKIALANRMVSNNQAVPHTVEHPHVVETLEDSRTKARHEARAEAEKRMLGASVNSPGTPWVHEDCGRESDCILNSAGGVQLTRDPVCARCQQCLDDACPIEGQEPDPVGFLDEPEPPEVEPEEDIFSEPPAIILNEKREVIGRIRPGEPTTYATV